MFVCGLVMRIIRQHLYEIVFKTRFIRYPALGKVNAPPALAERIANMVIFGEKLFITIK